MTPEQEAFRKRVMDAAETFDKIMTNSAWLIICAPAGEADAMALSNMSDRREITYMLFDTIARMDGARNIPKPKSTTQ